MRLSAHRAPSALISIGESRIGGAPDVPKGFEWPRWIPSNPRDDIYAKPWRPDGPAPLGFIAQIDLSDIPQVDNILPNSGWLYFFYDRHCEPWGFAPFDRGSCRVIYVDADRSELSRAQQPADVNAEHVAPLCRVKAWPELTLPDDLPEVQYGTPVYEAYQSLREELSKADSPWCHRFFGYPQLVQNPMELECQLVSHGIYCGDPDGYNSERAAALKQGAADWRLLLQIDTDEDGPGWMWGDVGRIYFWIKERDLASRRFDDVWLILQCC